jgi:xylan 1,4-beta-xylosidase
MYSGYTAASFARLYELVDQYKVNLRGAVSWSFAFEDQAWFAGFRDLATHGVDKPVLNVFRMLGMMAGQRVFVNTPNGLTATDIIAKGVRAQNDINALASKNQHSVWVMVWNYHDDDVAGPASPVTLAINGLGATKVLVHHYRVDGQWSNAFERWKAMGKPQQVTAEQYQELERAGQLQAATSPAWQGAANGRTELTFDLPRQGVSLLQLTW